MAPSKENKQVGSNNSLVYHVSGKASPVFHRHPRRTSSKKLPLETIDRNKDLFQLTMHLRVRVQDIRSLVNQQASVDQYVTHGEYSRSLSFRTLHEIQCAEGKLRSVVNAWKDNEDIDVNVEYKLQSMGKGKAKITD